jgi:hypothetical protein
MQTEIRISHLDAKQLQSTSTLLGAHELDRQN